MPASHRDEASEPGANLLGQVVLGRYRVMHPLARGGMGVVYLGRVEGSAGFTKPVVIKTIIPAFGSGEEGAALFAREARIVALLQHPGIVGVVDFGRVGRSYVMVLEYVHGYHIGQWAKYVAGARGALPVAFALHVVLEVLDALDYAHGLKRGDGSPLGIVHRDISPANILVDSQGHIKLGDFGVARMADDDYKTQDGQFRGTLPYSAPEAFQGAPATPSNDQYACAVVLYQLIAGHNPFRGNAPNVTVGRVLSHVPAPLSALRDDVPDGLDEVVARALAKAPGQRFSSVTEFCAALRATRPDQADDTARAFEAQVEKDFLGTEMPKVLGVEALAVRDAAWREAQRADPLVRLSSSPPGVMTGPVTIPANLGGSSPEDVTAREPLMQAARQSSNESASAGEAPAPLPLPAPAPGRWIPWAMGALTLAVLGVGAAVIVGRSSPSPATGQKLVVIEKQALADPAEATPPTAPVASEDGAPAGEKTAAEAPARATAAAGARPVGKPSRGAELARAFQRQESKVERCFMQHGAAEGQPALAVRFQIDATGAVRAATLTPGSVALTPLGQCIVAVASATTFGEQPDTVTFTIPIAARMVRHAQ